MEVSGGAPRPRQHGTGWAVNGLLPPLAVAIAYFIAGRLCLLMAIPPGYATAVWAGAGIALVAALTWGFRACVGIALGSFLVNVGTSFEGGTTTAIVKSIAIAASIGVGAGFQAWVGAALIKRFVGYPTSLDRDGHIALFLILGGPISCLVNATWGATTLLVTGLVSGGTYPFNWWTWWVGDSIGAVIFAPVLLTFIGQPIESWRRRRITLAMPLAIGFAVVTILFVNTSAWEQARHDNEFASRSAYLANALQRHLSQYIGAVESVASLFRTEQEVSGNEFHSFVSHALATHPGIRALEWIPRVLDDERFSFEDNSRSSGLPAFEIKAETDNAKLKRAPRAQEYFPVRYVEPLRGNEQALGFDINSQPERREALIEARTRGNVIATVPIRLVQEPGNQAGFLVIAPVFAPDATNSGDSNGPRNLRGFAAGVFRAGDIVEEALRGLDRKGMLVTLEDPSSKATLKLYSDLPSAQFPAYPPKGWSTTFQVAGRHWVLSFTPTMTLLATQRTWQAWMVLAGGLVFVGLLGAVLLIVTGRESRLLEAAESLRRNEARKTAIFNSALDAIVTMDHLGNVVEFNAAAEKMFGYHY